MPGIPGKAGLWQRWRRKGKLLPHRLPDGTAAGWKISADYRYGQCSDLAGYAKVNPGY